MLLLVFLGGCTSFRDYIHNGLKVGPNYDTPSAQVAQQWIDADDQRVRSDSDDPSAWWTVFDDSDLDGLIQCAYQQNLTLREAGCRILQARAQLGLVTGRLFPQTQNAAGDFNRIAASRQLPNNQLLTAPFYNQWDFGFNLGWELDFWGRFRRAIEAEAANLDASVENYDDVLVTLLGDVAANYVRMRTLQGRIDCATTNVKLQRETLSIVEARFQGGTTSELDVYQARSTLEQTEAQIPELEIELRQTINQLCILLGMPPEKLEARLGPAPIPTAPVEVAVGIPADLLRRRPDVRRAERLAAAQCAADRRGRGRFLSGVFDQRNARLFGPTVPGPVASFGIEQQHRPVVSVEPVELRPNSEQCPPSRRQIPGVGDRLPSDGPQREPRGRKRTGHVPPCPATHEAPIGQRAGR